ncbi:perlucin-like protein [Crassostrea angulata]|uniref:C-type lectin domain-containing protein n=2 Tax=Magallana gigas TaxID=29159 RepID=A0A8W8NC48_MAGGI|nr:perlucin-like protein [Crassostrea gigas]XP_052717087.1 perlucin-like protein [Crassostrea angulata]|eukprot:XP_011440979.1 PREDICTED: perlucin-like protein [Crassostrea gigas]
MTQLYFLLLVVLLAEQGRPQGTNNCRTGWKFFQESCYHFGSQKATWPEAEAYCWSMNSRLVEIETEAESNYLESQLRTIHQHASDSGVDQNEVSYWLGGNDIEIEGVFKWVKSDQPLTYADWSPGQPDDANGEDCMELRGAFQYHWNDLPCNIPHHFICEAAAFEANTIIGK